MTGSNKPGYPIGLAQAEGRNARLRAGLNGPELLMVPGCFDCLTARLVAAQGFAAGYISGSGVSMTSLGAPDMGVISYGEVIERARRITDSVDLPMICDVDTGYGGPINVIRTVREMERAGVSAIQIEDQNWPKKCGHEPGRNVVGIPEMVGRIKATVDARDDDDFVVDVALTDGEQDILLFSNDGRGIRFNESEVRPMGRTARGVIGLRLKEQQLVVAMQVAQNDEVLFATANGYGKRTAISDFPVHHRSGQGVIAIQTSERNGELVAALNISPNEDIMLISDGGTLVRTRTAEVSVLGRNTQGVMLIRLSGSERLVGLANTEAAEDDDQLPEDDEQVTAELDLAAPGQGADSDAPDGDGEPQDAGDGE